MTDATKPRQSILSLFPPPAFLTMPSVGIDISDRTIKFLELAGSRGAQTPIRFGARSLEEGIIQGGTILDVERLQAVLTALRKDLRIPFVRASLPEQHAYVYQTEVAAVSNEAQLVQTLEFTLEENVPLSPVEVILGYDVLGEGDAGGALSVAVTAYPRQNVERYVQSLEGAGLLPLSLEIESQAIARAVVPTGDMTVHLIVDFGETRTGLAIVSEGLLAFTSTIDVRGSDLTAAIQKHTSADANEIARIKNEEGVRVHGAQEALGKALIEVVDNLVEGIEQHYTYWNTQTGERHRKKIKRVLLCGGNANLAGLPEYISSRLRTNAERANVWKNAFSFEHAVPEISFEESLSYATAVGLALHRGE